MQVEFDHKKARNWRMIQESFWAKEQEWTSKSVNNRVLGGQ